MKSARLELMLKKRFTSKLAIVIAVGIIILGTILVFRSRDSIKTVTSSDGNLKIEIPKGALPKDTEITVKQLEDDKVPEPPFGTPWIGSVYEFGPSGSKFDKPAVVTVKLYPQTESKDSGEANLIIPWIIDDNQNSRPLDGESGQIVNADGSVTIISKISHFSSIGFAPIEQDDLFVSLFPEHDREIRKYPRGWPIGESGYAQLYFNFYSTLSTSGWFPSLDSPGVTWWADGTFLKTVGSGDWEELEMKSHEFDRTEPLPKVRRIKAYSGRTLYPFICDKVGLGWMSARISYRLFWDNIDGKKEPYMTDNWVSILRDIDCMDIPVKDEIDELFNKQPPSPYVKQETTPSSSTGISGNSREVLRAIFSFYDQAGKRLFRKDDIKLKNASKLEIRNNTGGEINKDGKRISGENLFDWLPIKIELKTGNQKVWQTEVTKDLCNEVLHSQYCSIPNYKYSSAWDGRKLYLYAYDKDGRLTAFHYEQ